MNKPAGLSEKTGEFVREDLFAVQYPGSVQGIGRGSSSVHTYGIPEVVIIL